MDIREYARQRDDLRVNLCGQVSGAVNFLHEKGRSTAREAIFIETILVAESEYTNAVAKLDAEYESQTAGVTA